ncbi:MAG: alpha/beta fold hydrolase [Alphaproteobacteria bacterium]
MTAPQVQTTDDRLLAQHNAKSGGQGSIPIVFVHGYGCDQSMWRDVLPAFDRDFRTVAFDLVGCGGSRIVYDPVRYGGLEGYADDVIAVCRAIRAGPVILVGHSVSAMIGAIAVRRQPDLFRSIIMISPSPRYISDAGYDGGFTRKDIDSLLDLMESDRDGWAATLASTVMGNPDRPELASDLEASFCRMDPDVARRFARITFTADNREDLDHVHVPTLVVQCRGDVIAPLAVGEYVHRRLRHGRLTVLDVQGHCPHVSAPAETSTAIRAFLTDIDRASAA